MTPGRNGEGEFLLLSDRVNSERKGKGEREKEKERSSVERNEGSETMKEERGRGEREREGKRKREIVAGMVVWPHPVEPANGLSADRRPT